MTSCPFGVDKNHFALFNSRRFFIVKLTYLLLPYASSFYKNIQLTSQSSIINCYLNFWIVIFHYYIQAIDGKIHKILPFSFKCIHTWEEFKGRMTHVKYDKLRVHNKQVVTSAISNVLFSQAAGCYTMSLSK